MKGLPRLCFSQAPLFFFESVPLGHSLSIQLSILSKSASAEAVEIHVC
jgi:hypothetical protein